MVYFLPLALSYLRPTALLPERVPDSARIILPAQKKNNDEFRSVLTRQSDKVTGTPSSRTSGLGHEADLTGLKRRIEASQAPFSIAAPAAHPDEARWAKRYAAQPISVAAGTSIKRPEWTS